MVRFFHTQGLLRMVQIGNPTCLAGEGVVAWKVVALRVMNLGGGGSSCFLGQLLGNNTSGQMFRNTVIWLDERNFILHRPG